MERKYGVLKGMEVAVSGHENGSDKVNVRCHITWFIHGRTLFL